MKTDDMLIEVKVEDAVGMVLAHDLTQILPGEFKGRLFNKGHVIREEDIPALLNIGKEHIYTLRLQPGFIHEDEAADRLANAVRGEHVELTGTHEGKITLKSAIHGLAKIDADFVRAVNSIDQVILSTILNNTVVSPKHPLAGTRVIPLIVEEGKVRQIEEMAASRAAEYAAGTAAAALPAAAPITVKPFKKLKAGLITTGSEVFKGRITDKFGPVVKDKVAAFGSQVIEQRFAPDESDAIIAEIRYFMDLGVDLLLITGGMSVDPDDRTPGAIKSAGADVVSYGTPMLPGSMLMMAYLQGVPVMGLPGCVMHDPYTSFDALLPRICAGEKISRQDIVDMGYGGLLS